MDILTQPPECRPKKRPKVKGCYECARRRIDCDRGEPQCQKCIQKGARCSGLGLRYRFNDGVASRGKFTGKSLPIATGKIISSSSTSPDNQRHIYKLPTERPSHQCRDSVIIHTGTERELSPIDNIYPNLYPIFQTLDHLNGSTRSLLHYYSQNIAPIMAVIDKTWNGYRDLILPISEADELVRKAVLVASTHHLALRTGGMMVASPTLYNEVLKGLMERSWLGAHVVSKDMGSIITVLLLLLCEMITGGENFALIYGMLKTFAQLGGGVLPFRATELGEFLTLQIHRIQLYAETLLSEADGSDFVSRQAEESLEFLRFCRNMHPEHEEFVIRLQSMIRQACDIYVHRAINNVPVCQTVHLVEQFILTAEEISHEPFGQNVLVWSYFIVAAESSTPRHRKFLVERMESLYKLTGFANTLKGLSQLKKIWENHEAKRWTSMLGGSAQVLIM